MPSQFQTTHEILNSHLVMSRDAGEDGMQGADANGIVPGDDLVVLATELCGHAEVGAFLAGDGVAENLQRLDQSVSRNVAGQFHPRRGSASQNLVADKMEADDFRRIHRFVEVAVHSLADVGAQLLNRVSVRVNAKAKRGSGKSAVNRVFLHCKNDFAHGERTVGAGESGVKPGRVRMSRPKADGARILRKGVSHESRHLVFHCQRGRAGQLVAPTLRATVESHAMVDVIVVET